MKIIMERILQIHVELQLASTPIIAVRVMTPSHRHVRQR